MLPGFLPQLEHGPSLFLELSALGSSWTPVRNPTTAEDSEAFDAVTTLGRPSGLRMSPRSEGHPLQVPLFGLTAGQWTTAHQVILPVWLRLPEVTKVTRCVLHPKQKKRCGTSSKMSCQHTHNFRERRWHILQPYPSPHQ